MKNIKTLAVAGFLGLVVGGLAIAQVHRNGGLNYAWAKHHGDPVAVVEHFGEVFPKVAAFDINKDGQLDDVEKEALGKALANGELELPAHVGPHGAKLTADVLLPHVAEMYTYVARYDTNHDGALDETERGAIKRAIENGEFAPHGQHWHEDADDQQ